MTNYKLIIEYYYKGNNNSQITKLCGCEKKTVIRVIKRYFELEITQDELKNIPDKQLMQIMYPTKSLKEGYLTPNYKWEEFQMVKHRASIRLCWRRYCKRATKQGLKAYALSRYFFALYQKYKKTPKANNMDAVRRRLKEYNLLLSMFRNPNGEGYKQMERDKEEWLKSLHLDEDKIIDEKDKGNGLT